MCTTHPNHFAQVVKGKKEEKKQKIVSLVDYGDSYKFFEIRLRKKLSVARPFFKELGALLQIRRTFLLYSTETGDFRNIEPMYVPTKQDVRSSWNHFFTLLPSRKTFVKLVTKRPSMTQLMSNAT
jgi:hypothetical protein